MANSAELTTVVSTKGQVTLPKSVRTSRRWDAGTRLVVEETSEGVLLRAAPLFPRTTTDQVYGILKHDGPPISLEQMEEAITEEVLARHARGRY